VFSITCILIFDYCFVVSFEQYTVLRFEIDLAELYVWRERRPMHAQMGHPAGRGPPMGWRPQGGPGLGHPQVGPSPYGAPAGPRGGPVTGVPQIVSKNILVLPFFPL
jgi:hypothetical protein